MRTVFWSRPLPPAVAGRMRARLEQEHRSEPFSSTDPRRTVRRVAGVAHDLGLEVTVYRGGLDLRGTEVDHIWVELHGRVVDVAFPLFVERFVQTLRRFVAGDAGPDELANIAALAGLEERVVGLFPEPMRYLGQPVWSARQQQG